MWGLRWQLDDEIASSLEAALHEHMASASDTDLSIFLHIPSDPHVKLGEGFLIEQHMF